MNQGSVQWNHKLSVRIPLINSIIILIVILVMCTTLSVLTGMTVTNLTKEEIASIADSNSQEVISYFNNMLIFSEALSYDVERYQSLDQASADKMLRQSLQDALKNDKIFSAYYAFEPNAYFPDTPKGLSYYAFKDGNSILMDVYNDYDVYSTGDYYAPAKEMLKTHVTAPYSYELSTGETVWMVTLSTPILNEGGKFIGVANCDILTNSFGGLNYDTGGYKSSCSYIVTQDGTCIANTADKESIGQILKVVSDNKEISQAVANSKEILTENDNPYDKGKNAWIFHEPLTLSGTDLAWSSAFVVNKGEALAAVTKITVVLTAIGIVGLIVLVACSALFLKKGLAPISSVMKLGEKMGRCDLKSEAFQIPKTKDELGQLANIFHGTSLTLSGYISDISNLLRNISNGNLQVEVKKDYIGDFEAIKDALNHILSSLNDIFKEMQTVAEQVSTGADQVSVGAQELSQGAILQASSIEELSAKIMEISDQVKQSTENAGIANERAETVGTEIETSNQQMHQLLAAMDDITQKSGEIGKIIKTIEDIAFQTNILALNAAVEAARAGEAGKGFAVVADEVRNLASKSAEAAKDTTALIEGSLHSINEGARIAEVTAASLGTVVLGTKDIVESIGEISVKSKDQSVALEEVTLGIDQISSVVQNNAATAEESAASSQELSAQAQLLKDLIGRFNLKN
ncbi:methyl-accepting chemotaxis protein [Clostridium aminobutyricum]|uniref:Methyl-accepting chemotaxis protein n=1 Tax=Clostridium aminobutyricum TaxID=33953 RepID=A0A939D8G1_CLOAM|nr:methyl-accepting chemotaxis protein [Clostridium aminobutyricum]MBN7773002.1 methyl-accepting chemotaxis protein [Clostridium aminobutyricum]